jgi:hypothetical protein
VQRDRPDVYEDLRRSFELDPRVEVILDGRRGDRRTQPLPAPRERRRQDRRQPLPPVESAFAQHAGFFLLVRDDPRPSPPSARSAGRRR